MQQKKLPITVIFLTLNEQHNLPEALQNVLPWVQGVIIVDSLSTDRTVDIALEHGVTVVQRPFTNFGDQWNWALERLPIETPWTMKLDPDERVTPELQQEIADLLTGKPACTGYSFRRRLWFMGKPLRQTQWVLRLWRTGKCRFSPVLVNEHPIIDGPVGQLRCGLDHFDSPNLHHWFEKQNLYSTMRAIEMVRRSDFAAKPNLFGDALARRMFFKKVFFYLPFRHALMWFYLGVLRGALLDGPTGWAWIRMRVSVLIWAQYKAREMRQTGVIPEVPIAKHGDFDPRVIGSDDQRRVGPTLPPAPKPVPRTKRLRLAVNAVSAAPGGSLVVLLGYLKAWQELGTPMDIQIYASRAQVQQAVAQAVPGVRVIPFATGSLPAKHFLMQQLSLGPQIQKTHCDVVLTTNAMIGRCGVPQVVHHQNLKRFVKNHWVSQLLAGGLGEAVKDVAARKALRRSAMNVFISHYLRQQAERLVPESRLKNHVVYNGLDSQALATSRRPDSAQVDRAKLIAIQAPSPHKDNPTLFRCLARLVELRPDTPWRLSIAGDGDWSGPRRLAQQLGVDDRIEYLGYVDHQHLEPLFRRSLCLVFTSRLEGFGLPPLEAMAMRCPAIACRATAMPEIVGDAGILVEPGDSEQFAQAVLRLADHPQQCEELITRGVEHIKHFSWHESASKMAKLIEQAADSTYR